MILGPLARCPPELLTGSTDSNSVSIERVQQFKLLGINLSHDMCWQAHIDAISTKAASRLHFLRILKKSGLNPGHLLHFYLTVIRPLLEYCSVVWHHTLSKTQSESLEAIQRRALRIIYPQPVGLSYSSALQYADLSSLYNRRGKANKQFFRCILQPSSCIFPLLPPQRDPNITSRLRNASIYPRPATRTKRYMSFIDHCLLTCQD
jgi:hypothetical protein